MVRLFRGKVGGGGGALPVKAVEQIGGGRGERVTDLTAHLWSAVVVAGFSGALGPMVM